MKKILLILPLLLYWSCEDKQEDTSIETTEETVVFVKTFGGIISEVGRSVQQTTDGGYIITGYTDEGGAGNVDIWLIKTDSNGDSLWTQTFSDGQGHSVQQTTDGGYIITGHTHRSFEQQDVLLIRTDSEGNEVRNQTFGGSGGDYGYSVQQTNDGGYIITGKTNSFGNGGNDFWLIKTYTNGNEEWNKTFGGSATDYGYSVQQTTDGGYIITGFTNSFGNGSSDVWLIKTDANGDSLWTKTFGGSDSDEGLSVQQTTDGGYIIIGDTESYGNGGRDLWLIKTDSNGDSLWTQTFSDGQGHSVQQTTDGGYIITGYTDEDWAGNRDICLIKTDSNGIEEWNQTFGGGGAEEAYSVQQTIDGGYIITGSTYSFGNGEYDIWLIKTDSQGNTVDYP